MTLFQLCLVYDWGPHGNIVQYVVLQPQASRPSLVRRVSSMRQQAIFSNSVFLAHNMQLFDVIKGLEYLHDLGIPHGDLKGVGCSFDLPGIFYLALAVSRPRVPLSSLVV